MSPFVERLVQLQAKHHRDLATVVATLDNDYADDFALAVRAVLHFTTLKQAEMGDGLSVSQATINRWASGQVAPHPLIRKTTREWLVRELNQRADMIEAFPGDLGSPQDDYIPQKYLPLEMQRPR